MTPDMIVRELANGFWFFFQLQLALLLLAAGLRLSWQHGRGPVYDAAISFGLFLCTAIVMRGWVMGFLWQANHGFETTLRDDYWAAIASVALGSAIGSYLVFRLTPAKAGHLPWIAVLLTALGLPLALHFAPYALGLSPWPPAWSDLGAELRAWLP